MHEDRGLVAAGHFTSNVYEDDHWADSGKRANFADVTWTTWLAVNERLPVEVLKQRVPGVSWDRMQSSGVKVQQSEAAALDELWAEHLRAVDRDIPTGPDEVPPTATYPEGAVTRVVVNRYERGPQARAEAIALHGLDCAVCGFNFEAAYGRTGADFIHIHHVRELSTLPHGYRVNPSTDRVPPVRELPCDAPHPAPPRSR